MREREREKKNSHSNTKGFVGKKRKAIMRESEIWVNCVNVNNHPKESVSNQQIPSTTNPFGNRHTHTHTQ